MADGLLNKASIILTPTGYKAGTLYNVAPVVEPYEDFDFARASVASRVNSSGLVEMVGRTLGSELITNGDFATDSDWTKLNATISGGKGNLDGNGQTSMLWQDILSNGNSYKAIFTVSDYNGSGSAKIINNNASTIYTITSNGTFTINFTHSIASGNFIFRATSGAVFSIDNVSVKEVIDTNNIPRISYDSNGDNGHILLEPTSTNLITYSEDFEDSSWDLDVNAAHITRTPNAAISPSGENNATKLIGNDTSRDPGGSYIAAITSASAPYTASVFAKKAEYDYLLMSVGTYAGGYWGSFNLSNGTVDTQPTQANTSASIESYGNGWYRCSLTTTTASGGEFCLITPSVDGTLLTDYTSTTNGIYVWGAQLEELSYATSYIPTLTGSTETRATETATGAGSAELINSTEGVLYAEIAAFVNSGLTRYLGLNDGSSNNRVVILNDGTANRIRAIVSSGGTKYADLYYSVTDVTDFHKVAVKYKANDFALWIDGVERVTETSGSAPIGLNDLDFELSGSPFYGKCKALAVFNEALSDSELTQLTT